MKQKISNNIDAVHYYEWTHCCCSSIFFRSILEDRMLFLDRISSDTVHLKFYNYYNTTTNIIDNWYKSYYCYLFWIDTFQHLYLIRSIKPYINDLHWFSLHDYSFYISGISCLVYINNSLYFALFCTPSNGWTVERSLMCSINIDQHTFDGTTVSFYFLQSIQSFT